MMEPREDATLSALLREQATRHAPPESLADAIRARLRQSAAPAPVPLVARWRRWLEGLALYGAGLATAWVAASVLLVVPAPAGTAQQVAAGHVRSLLADHLTDVQSSDRHAVKPWFAGKLDFSPPVVDLADQGFPLAGGRLDYLDGRAVAALVYKPGAHVVNVFMWPAPDTRRAEAPRLSTKQGYHIVQWSAAGMQAWAVSDMGADELQGFANLLRARMDTPEARAGS